MINISRLNQSFKALSTEFYPYRTIIAVMFVAMWIKIALESVLPLLLIPLFGEISGEMSSANSRFVETFMQWLDYVQTSFGFSSRLETTFYLAMAVVIPKAVFTIVFGYLQSHVQYTYENNKRNELFSLFLRLNWVYFLNLNSGKTINTLYSETHRAAQVFTGIASLIESILLILVYLIISSYVSLTATLFGFAAFGVLVMVLIPAAKRAKWYGKQSILARENMMHHFSQLVHSFKVLKGSRMEAAGQKFIAHASEQNRHYYVRTGIVKMIPGALFEPVIILALFGLIISANVYSFVSIAEATVVAVFIYRSYNKSANMHKFWISFYEYQPSLLLMQNLPNVYIEHQEERPSGTVEQFEDIQFNQIRFQYPTGNTPALTGIDLHIRRGEYIGIVGTSGCGKTTLVDTFLYLLKPEDGTIKVNGKNLKEIDPWQWRELIGYVPQDSIMLNDSVKNNIALYRPNIKEEDIQWAAKIADADLFIQELPNGYNTIIGERGSRISGGQRQRLALARALVHHPQILLLDEATSALDTFTEKKIQESVDQLKGQFTIVVIAHRLSTLMNADRIIVLDAGQIIQMGTPDELLMNQGTFQNLYQQQFHDTSEAVQQSHSNPV